MSSPIHPQGPDSSWDLCPTRKKGKWETLKTQLQSGPGGLDLPEEMYCPKFPISVRFGPFFCKEIGSAASKNDEKSYAIHILNILFSDISLAKANLLKIWLYSTCFQKQNHIPWPCWPLFTNPHDEVFSLLESASLLLWCLSAQRQRMSNEATDHYNSLSCLLGC